MFVLRSDSATRNWHMRGPVCSPVYPGTLIAAPLNVIVTNHIWWVRCVEMFPSRKVGTTGYINGNLPSPQATLKRQQTLLSTVHMRQ